MARLVAFGDAHVQLAHPFDDAQACPHRALRVLFVSLRVTEIGQNAVADVARDESLVAFDRRLTHPLIRAYQLAQILWILALRELGGTDQVAKHDRELATLGRAGAWGLFLASCTERLDGMQDTDPVAGRAHPDVPENVVIQVR